MNLGRRTVYALLLVLVCLNLLVRLPRTSHESGVDSFSIHYFGTAVAEHGDIPWVLNALGYFGWYPLSYPSAVPVLIAGLSQTTGLTGEGTILLLSLLYGVLGMLVAFVMARAFLRNDLFALSVAALFSLAPRFMTFTLWSASTRNLFMMLIPVLLWGLVRTYRRPTIPNMFVLVSTLTIMLATHRLTILLAIVVLAFVAAHIFILAHRVLRIRFSRVLLAPTFRRWMPGLAILGIAAIALSMLVGTEVLEEYAWGEVCLGASLQDQICNLGVSITRSVGLALPLALGGVFVMVREHNKGFAEAFLTSALLALIPTLFLRQYTGFYILPFLSLFAGYGIVGLAKWLRHAPRTKVASIAVCLVVALGSSLGILGMEIERTTSMPDASYTSGLYLLSLPKGNFVANDGLLAVRMASTTGIGGLPIGGAGTTDQSPELLILGAISAEEVFLREQRIPLLNLTIEDDSPFYLKDVSARIDWTVGVLQQEAGEVRPSLIARYNLKYYVENDALRGAYVGSGEIYRQPQLTVFIQSTYATRYKLFDGPTVNVFLVFGP